jgi:phage baseplate assembly protein W
MAIEIKINPIDFEPDIAVGIDLPLVSDTQGVFKLNYTTLDQALANAKNLLLTNKGERVMQPEFGCNLQRILFENLTEELTLDVETLIRAEFEYWLPYIFINELQVTPYEDNNRMQINLTISLEGNKFDTRSVQLEITNTQ